MKLIPLIPVLLMAASCSAASTDIPEWRWKDPEPVVEPELPEPHPAFVQAGWTNVTAAYETLPDGISEEMSALFEEMDAQRTLESKVYKALDKLEALIQHNESPIDTWSENEYGLNKTYAFDAVAFSDWLTSLRQEVLKDTLEKIASEG